MLFCLLCLGFAGTLYGTQDEEPAAGKDNADRPTLLTKGDNSLPRVPWWKKCHSPQDCKALRDIIGWLQDWPNKRPIDELPDIVAIYHHVRYLHLRTKYHKSVYWFINAEVSKSKKEACAIDTCVCYARTQRYSAKKAYKADADQADILLRDLLDRMHVYWLHGSDLGYRYRHHSMQNTSKDLFDPPLAKIKAWQAECVNISPISARKERFYTTMLTNISLEKLEAKFGGDKAFQEWMKCLLDNTCDTDSILAEMEADAKQTVIPIAKPLLHKLKAYILAHQVLEAHQKMDIYAFGVRLYYWNRYKHNTDIDQCYNIGTPFCNFYVTPIYASLKEEILAKGMPLHVWHQTMYAAETFLAYSSTLREFKAGYSIIDDVAENSPLAVNHILSILLYTDFPALCSAFRRSFRGLSPTECAADIVGRNAKWHFLSKYLSEVVELFGEPIGRDEDNQHVDKGNFYHAMAPDVVLDTCCPHFFGPVSTSKQLEVAMLHAHDGLILALKPSTGLEEARLRCFNVSLLSCCPAEDERLLMGGPYAIRIASIYILQAPWHTASLMHALLAIERMLKGEELDRYRHVVVNASDKVILGKFISSTPVLPHYVQQVWDKYRHAQQRLTISMRDMSSDYELLYPLLFASAQEYKNVLLLDKIAELFPNVTEIVCQYTDLDIETGYTSSTIVNAHFVCAIKRQLAQVPQHSQLNKIVIETSKYEIEREGNLSKVAFGRLGWVIALKKDQMALMISRGKPQRCIVM